MAEGGEDALGLTEKQRGLFEKFKENVADVTQPHHDDYFLIRWMKARAFDLNKAEDMLRANLSWRQKYKIDTILEDYKPPEVLTKYFPGGLAGCDKEGCPIWITPSGGLDMKGLTLSAKRSDIIMYNIFRVEETCKRLQELEKKTGKHIGKVIIIDDFEGFTMKKLFQPGMDLLLKILAIVEANYPELLRVCYVVNAPRWWSLVFNICKPFLSEDTKNKMYILGSDWKEKILQEVDPDQLPEAWGGSISGSGEVCIGGDVPSSYYLSDQTLVDPDKWTHVSIAAGSKIDVQITVSEPKSVLKWVFKTESHDIAFGVTYIIDVSTNSVPPSPTDTGAPKELVRSLSGELKGEGNPRVAVKPIARVNCHQIPEDGYLECEQTGTYLVHFCNSHSWMTSKKLQYYIQVISPSANVTDSSVTSDLMGEK